MSTAREEQPLSYLTLPAAAALAIAAALPLLPDGTSMAEIVANAFRVGIMPGLLTLTGLASPFLFGLGLAIAAPLTKNTKPGDPLRRLFEGGLMTVLTFLHAQLVLFAGLMVLRGVGVGRFSLLGFALVSGLYLVYRSAHAQAMAKPLALSFLARWGGLMVVSIAAFCRLQLLGGLQLGYAVDVCFACGALLVASNRIRPVRIDEPMPQQPIV